MLKKKPRIYFLGSGPITIPILRTLLNAPQLELVGLGSQVDRPAGRKRQLCPTPFAAEALALGRTVDRFANVNTPESLAYLASLKPDILLVVSFGQILREPLLNLPAAGCVNVHASLLPQYRGAAPITCALLQRDVETGVVFMAMEKGLDTGGVYRTFRMPLNGTERADTLEMALGTLAAEHAAEVLCSIAAGFCRPIPQSTEGVSVCTKIKKSDGDIDWTESALRIEAMTRAFYPWPGCRFKVRVGERIQELHLLSARMCPGLASPGAALQCDKYGWIVGCGDHALQLLTVAVPGKREMPATAYLNGLQGGVPEIILDNVPAPGKDADSF